MLVFFNGADVFAFSTTLAVYLFGLVVGSLIVSRWTCHEHDAERLGWALVALAGLGYAGLFSAPWVEGARAHLQAFSLGKQWLSLFSSGLVVVPGAVALGLIFPLAARHLRRAFADAGATVGNAYLINTLGSVSGALLAGFVLLPGLGLQRSLTLASLITSLVGCWVLSRQSQRWRAGIALVAFGGAVAFTPTNFLARSLFEKGDTRILFQADDHYGSIAIVDEWDSNLKVRHENLVVDGFNMAGNSLAAKRYTVGLSAIPLVLHPQPKDVLVVCLGMGNTLSTALQYDQTERVDCVELSRQVARGLRVLPQGQKALSDPKLRLIIGDGRNHLLNTSRRYDVISAEPPPPTHAGIVNLYSREYYELCRDRLKPGGLAVQWLPVFQLSPFEAKTIIKAFLEVFPEAYLWEASELQLILVGSSTPLDKDFARLKRQVEANRQLLAPTGWDEPLLFPATLLGTPEMLREYTREVPALTDDWPSIQYSHGGYIPDLRFYFFSGRPPVDYFTGLDVDDDERLAQVRRALLAFHIYEFGSTVDPELSTLERHDLMGQAFETFPNDPYLQARTLSSDAIRSWLERAAVESPTAAENYYNLARIHLLNNRYSKALDAIDAALATDSPHHQFYQLYRGLCLFRLGRE
ncbi:MAG: fused MFS/spermidine synthase, partial [Candidatus Eremiobacteraeota bacterium]|nr:fused MFS/spermidine synthase [Candidatus Eremiobacteraeota bacterium]